MLDDKSLLELCVKVSGGFENGGGAHYDTIAGNFDGQGISVGILQWNAGQGTLQVLLQKIGKTLGWQKIQSYFKSDIQHLSTLKTADAIQFCIEHYIATGTKKLDPNAEKAWQQFLDTPESVAAQIELASDGVLAHAKSLVRTFCSDHTDRLRPYAFFFDLVTQSGGMRNSRGSVLPVPSGGLVDYQPALDMAKVKDIRCATFWETNVEGDPLAKLLLYYAFKRSVLSAPQYIWDALSRRGSLACRHGVVHEATVDLTKILD